MCALLTVVVGGRDGTGGAHRGEQIPRGACGRWGGAGERKKREGRRRVVEGVGHGLAGPPP